jgi:hypothetical protein
MTKPNIGTRNPISVGNIVSRPSYDAGIFGTFKKNTSKKKARRAANKSKSKNRIK